MKFDWLWLKPEIKYLFPLQKLHLEAPRTTILQENLTVTVAASICHRYYVCDFGHIALGQMSRGT